VALLHDVKIRLLQLLALFLPGATGVRVRLHRWRGVEIGPGAFISTDVIIETMHPELVSIGRDVFLGVRSTIIAHFRDVTDGLTAGARFSVRIEDQVFVGPGAIILPGVRIGRGAVVAAGSVVSGSVPEMTLVQGNPARPVALCGVPLGPDASVVEFYRKLKPIQA
jgi:acetyltransferase-like isoleucine patch superfamily enzyme